jgi:sigma-B regulation protein RsbU (phosphoserine phosphatase)
VPLLSAGELVGVLHVGRLDDRRFGQTDIELLEVAADRVTSAVQVHQLAMERAAAALLERSLLPPRLPDCSGLTFAARYAPAEDRAVGGDWYDAFTLPSARLWVAIGDVAGHGLPAAVVMGRVRSAMRSYALEDYPVDEVLKLVDRKVRHFEVGAMVTVACATSMPPYEQFEIASAGHPPPALAVPGRPTVLIDLDVMPPLGDQSNIRCPPTTVHLPVGSVLVFYTDGLVERRDDDLDHRLARLCTALDADHPETVCRTVMHDMIGSHTPEDDVAILAIRRTG